MTQYTKNFQRHWKPFKIENREYAFCVQNKHGCEGHIIYLQILCNGIRYMKNNHFSYCLWIDKCFLRSDKNSKMASFQSRISVIWLINLDVQYGFLIFNGRLTINYYSFVICFIYEQNFLFTGWFRNLKLSIIKIGK